MNRLEGLIVILGSPNDAQGNLSPMGQQRVAKGYAEYLRLRPDGWKILLTGGYGAHFNTTNKPHAFYAQQLLLAWGVASIDIVEFAESRHTQEDAVLSRPIVAHYGVQNLLVVTSDFHMARTEFIFTKIFVGLNLYFAAAEYLTLCGQEEQRRLLEHEAQALMNLRITQPF
ncbi:hypothetical protein BH10CHL1_BH10CHL1_40460 [soil metagenome]